MSPFNIAQCRLLQQQISSHRCRRPAEVVAALGAMQAQDYSGALWSIGLRLPEAGESTIERSLAERTIVRTWLMRGTLHFVAAADVRWMLELLTPRIIAGRAANERYLELDAAIFARCEKLFVRALAGGRQLTREAMMELLESNRISTAKMRGYHILWRLAQAGLIVFAARSGKSHTFSLLDEWVASAKKLERAAALGELARRYFPSHGPATLTDFAGWSGLKVGDARAGMEAAASALRREKIGDADFWMTADTAVPDHGMAEAYLLPGFDEYLLGYKDRGAVLEAEHAQKIVPGSNGVFLPTVILQGRVAGTWKRAVKKTMVEITVSGFRPLKKVEQRAVVAAAGRYGQFLGMPVEVN